MTLIRYIARVYASSIALTLLGLTIIVVTAGLVESGTQLSRSDSVILTAMKMAGFRGVQFAYQVLPAACLLGALVAGTALARRGELLAIQAGGIGANTVRATFVVVAAVAGLLGTAAGEYLVPEAMQEIEEVKRDEMGGIRDRLTRFYSRPTTWFRKDDRILYLPKVNTKKQLFMRPVVYERSDGLISSVTRADELRHDEEGWYLLNAERLTVSPPATESLPRAPLALDVKPRDLTDVTGDPRQMGMTEMAQIIERRRSARLDVTSHRVELHTRLAYPLAPIVMLLLVVPWALHPDRRRSLAVTLGWGVVVIAVFFAITYAFRLLALGRKIATPMGAWGVMVTCLCLVPLSYLAYRRYRIRGSLW